MTLATGTILLLLGLTPGFAWHFALASNARLVNVTPKSQMAEIATMLLLSLLVHVLTLACLALCVDLSRRTAIPLPHVGLTDLFEFIESTCAPWQAQCNPSAIVTQHHRAVLAMVAYLGMTTFLGLALGNGVAILMETKVFGFTRFHSWIHGITNGLKNQVIYVTVFTNINHEGRYLSYRGVLDQITLDSEQNLKTIFLRNAYKEIVPLFASPPADRLSNPPVPTARHDATRFVVGEDIPKLMIPAHTILNFAMEIIGGIEEDPAGQQALAEALARLHKNP